MTAALSCLEAHFGQRVPLAARPGLVLSAESDLGITAGLQDRVIQSYEGIVHMARGRRPGSTRHARCARASAHSPPVPANCQHATGL